MVKYQTHTKMPSAAFWWNRSGARKEEAKQTLKYLNLPV
ncbi:hypothetical protein GMES_4488 [Paraglaciecola mesophila KMM 241]|uniref:Uncharacterized protein n=1 Tax=Paraglaciecola mesophila KMM 241 TaxID=1128912 RepID=K6Y1P7_9ALTE|nr:hypothetical protein GMES_4488 [Paraglaciecola mesophila KMM 241]